MQMFFPVFLTASLFGGSQHSDQLRPDLRHWSEDIYQAAPQLEDFEDFLSDLDLNGKQEDLQLAQKERLENLIALESIEISKATPGRGYIISKQMLELLFKISSYQRMAAERSYFYSTSQWRLQDPSFLKKINHQGEIEQTSLKAVGMARKLVNDFPFDPDYNQYLLIRLLARTHNGNILLFYDQFKKSFQHSKYLPYVHQFVAEYYFQAQQWDHAESLLKTVMDSKDPTIRPYAAFKLAWVHIMRAKYALKADVKKQNLAKAQIALRLCLKLMRDWDFHQPLFQLQNEAALDLAMVAAELRNPNQEVLSFLNDSKLQTYYLPFLRYQAVDAIRDGDAQLAESAFAEYLPMESKSRELPQDLMSQIELFLLTRSFDKVLEGYKQLRNLFNEESEWFQEWQGDKPFLELCHKQLAKHLAFTALKIQQEADQLVQEQTVSATVPNKVKLSQAQLRAHSRNYYNLLMEWYPGSDAQDDARYNYALVVFQSGDMEQAITLLTKITKDSKSQHQRDAAYSLVMVVAQWDARQSLPKLPLAAKAKKPVPLTKSKILLIETINQFAKAWPTSPELLPALYTAAQTLFDFGHYEDAIQRFDKIIQSTPKSEQADAALNTLLSYQVETGRWPELIAICQTYLANKEITAAGHRKIIKQTLEYARSQSKN